MYCRLEVQLAYLVHFAHFLLWFAPHFAFAHSKLQSYILRNNWFFFKNTFEFFFLLFGLVPLAGRNSGGLEKLPVRGTACTFGQLCPIFTGVCSLYFSALQISFTLLGITFFMMDTFTFCSLLFSLHLTFWYSILVLYHIGIIFPKNIYLFLGRVPNTAHLIAQHTSYGHQMTLYRDSAETKVAIIQQQAKGFWLVFK